VKTFPISRTARALQGLLVLGALLSALPAAGQTAATAYLRDHGRPPVEYVLAKLRDHRAVLLGESHRIRHDVELVIDLVPRLREAGADTLAMELLPASEQATVDRVVTAERWDPAAAMGVLRTAAWPYREYLEVIHAVWRYNQGRPADGRLRLAALGPGTDWRERLLPRGETYDLFMARAVLDLLKQPGRRVLVYSGLHHAFTRYYQPESPSRERVERFMDRMGNVLWRELGEETFLIVLPAPWQCRSRAGEPWTRCLPAGGAVDCAAAPLGRPVGFDVPGSPFAGARISRDVYYGQGYPDLRLEDLADGFLWTRPVEEYQGTSVIPLAEFALGAASLAQVAANDPFSDEKGLGRAGIEKLWREEAERLRDLQKSSGWLGLAGWRERCAAPEAPGSTQDHDPTTHDPTTRPSSPGAR
jgi:hypothetical protein